jgi:hypothetical protein
MLVVCDPLSILEHEEHSFIILHKSFMNSIFFTIIFYSYFIIALPLFQIIFTKLFIISEERNIIIVYLKKLVECSSFYIFYCSVRTQMIASRNHKCLCSRPI